MPENPFTKVMAQRTDLELYKILNESRDSYQEEAVTAAELEFKKRNLSHSEVPEFKIQEFEDEIAYEKQTEEEKANESLFVLWKILTFIKPGLIQFFISFFLRTRGYHKKAKELSSWTLFGFAFYLIVIFIILINRQ